jgi:transcriptional regulator with XRE-family HTH domain
MLRNRLGANVRYWRYRSKFTQAGFADIAGIHRSYVGAIERCSANIRVDKIEKLARALGVAAHELLRKR